MFVQCTLGTNPISVAAPARGGDSFVLDMATSAVALGKVRTRTYAHTHTHTMLSSNQHKVLKSNLRWPRRFTHTAGHKCGTDRQFD